MKTKLIDKDALKEIKELKNKLNSVKKKISLFKKEYKDDIVFCSNKLFQIGEQLEKSLFDQLLTSTKKEINKTISMFDKQIEKLPKLALSEVVWTRAKELELKITNPILYFKIRREFNSILSRLEELDKGMSISKEEDYKEIICDIDGIYSEFKDEKIKSLFKVLYPLLILGIMVVTAIYTLSAMEYITMDRRSPLIIGSVVIAFIILALGFNIFSWFKLLFNVLKERKFLIIFLILLLIMAISPSYFIYKDNRQKQSTVSCLSQIASSENVSSEVKGMITEDISRIKQKSLMLNIITSILIVIPLFLIISLPYAKGGKGILIYNKLCDIEKQNF